MDDGGADGFMLLATYTPGCFEEFVDMVVPELQRRGRYRHEYPQRPCATTSSRTDRENGQDESALAIIAETTRTPSSRMSAPHTSASTTRAPAAPIACWQRP